MKLHWGNMLLLFFILYVSFLGFVLFKSTQQDRTLVMENYYEHDIDYQQHYEAVVNGKKFSNNLTIDLDEPSNTVKLDFGKEMDVLTGSVKIYAPSNKNLDQVSPFTGKQSVFKVPFKEIAPGKYKIQVQWRDDQRSYFREVSILKS